MYLMQLHAVQLHVYVQRQADLIAKRLSLHSAGKALTYDRRGDIPLYLILRMAL